MNWLTNLRILHHQLSSMVMLELTLVAYDDNRWDKEDHFIMNMNFKGTVSFVTSFDGSRIAPTGPRPSYFSSSQRDESP